MRRTRSSVVDAFADLAREKPYDEIRISEVVAEADVGRSTFYAHYQSKDDLLVQSLGMFYTALAEELVLGDGVPSPRMLWMLEHFSENQLLARRLTTGPAVPAYQRSLSRFAADIAAAIAKRVEAGRPAPALPAELVGEALARAVMGAILGWLMERPGTTCAPELLARGLHDIARGALAASPPSR